MRLRKHEAAGQETKQNHLPQPIIAQRLESHRQGAQWLCDVLNETSLKCKGTCCDTLSHSQEDEKISVFPSFKLCFR